MGTIDLDADEKVQVQSKLNNFGNEDLNLIGAGKLLFISSPTEGYDKLGKFTEMQKFNSENSTPPNAYEVDLVWKNLTVVSKEVTKGCFKKVTVPSKTLLSNVNGRVKGGECLAILGSTGAGKTTLLNYLSKKIESANLTITGDILLNNRAIDPDKFNLISSYVMQDDILEPLMTPTEILLFTAKLRLTLSNEEIENRVLNMLKTLNLMKCKDTRIGDALVRGVSGGERKRTSIAVELITDPKVIFLDEPTTGLDSFNAYEVVSLLKQLSTQGRIVIFTIHQPASEIFPLVDKICVLGLGKTIYFGLGSKCLGAFKHMRIPVPHRENPFQHFMEVTTVTSVKSQKVLNAYPELKDIDNVQDRYENYISSLSEKFIEKKDEYKDDSKLLDGISKKMEIYFDDRSVKNGFFYEFGMLFGRNTMITMRNPQNFFFKIVQYVASAILFGILFINLSREFSGVQDRLGLILLVCVSFVLNASTNQILIFFSEKKVFLRERANKLYSISSYYMAKYLNDIPVYLFAASLFTVILYYSTFLNDMYSYKYYIFIGIILLGSMGGISVAFFLGSFINNPEALIGINTAISIPLLILSGFFTNAGNFAPYLIPFKYLSFYKYVYQLLIENEFTDQQPFYCFDSNPDTCAPLANRFTFLEASYISWIGMVAVIIFFNLLAFLILYKFAKIRV